MKTGFAKQRDKNEKPIVDVLLAVGASVTRLNEAGVPDLLVGFEAFAGFMSPYRRTLLLEVKGPLGPKGGTSHRNLTPAQERWWANWKGDTIIIVRSPEEALRAIGLNVVDSRPGIWTYCPLSFNERDGLKSCDGEQRLCPVSVHHRVGTYPRTRQRSKP